MKKNILWSILFSMFFISCMQQQKELSLTSIYVSKMPSKVYYAYDEPLDLTELEVTACYSDGTEKIVDGWTSMPKPWSKLKSSGTVTITITYEGKTTDFPITIIAEGEEIPEEQKGNSKQNPIILSMNKWTKGEIVKLKDDKSDEKWFKFVATTSTQRVYVKFGTMNCIAVAVYDSDYNSIGNSLNTSGDIGSTSYIEKPLIIGETYYIKVFSGEYRYDGRREYTGTYWIGFTEFPAKPETVITHLTDGIWANGKIETESNGGTGEQWFKFIATSSAQRVYVKFGTMNCIAATLYDCNYNLIGNSLNTSGDASTTSFIEKPLIIGETYYIKVTSGEYRYDGRRGYTGTYWIGFTEFPAKPETVITHLTDGIWASGKIETESNGGTGEQWFKFIATSSTQRVYVKFGTMNCIAVAVYDSDYNSIGNSLNTSGDIDSTSYIEKPLIIGETYYIKVFSGEYRYDGRSGYTGTYWIAFNSNGEEQNQ